MRPVEGLSSEAEMKRARSRHFQPWDGGTFATGQPGRNPRKPKYRKKKRAAKTFGRAK
jgi:hypothetical protein